VDWSKVESPLERQKREGDDYLAEMRKKSPPQPERPPSHENTLRLYQCGLLSAGLIRHLAATDEILALKADRLGVPTADELASEIDD
jgi:hypothetical protein